MWLKIKTIAFVGNLLMFMIQSVNVLIEMVIVFYQSVDINQRKIIILIKMLYFYKWFYN